MRRWTTLNDRQLAVLRRVAAGDTLSATTDGRARLSARALRDRGLLRLTKVNKRWTAAMTDAGRFYLERGHHPDRPSLPDTAPTQAPNPPRITTASTRHRPPRQPAVTARRRVTAATELLRRLTGRTLVRLECPDKHTLAEWRRTIDYAKRHRLVPSGSRLKTTRIQDGSLIVQMLQDVHPSSVRRNPPSLVEVPVPEQLRGMHPVVDELRRDTHRLVMPRNLRYRCLLILHALTQAALRQGYTVLPCPVPRSRYRECYDRQRGYYQGYWRRDGAVTIVADGLDIPVTIMEVSPQVDDPVRQEQLILAIPAYGRHGYQYRWADRKRATVEGALPAVLQEIALRAQDARQQRLWAEQEEIERRHAWEAAMRHARDRATHAHFATMLRRQAADWRTAQQLRIYCDALHDKLGLMDRQDPQVMGSVRWLNWAHAYIQTLDPLTGLPSMPEPPTLDADALQPYLDGWSASGPR